MKTREAALEVLRNKRIADLVKQIGDVIYSDNGHDEAAVDDLVRDLQGYLAGEKTAVVFAALLELILEIELKEEMAEDAVQ
jgi:S1-C subfamily serine protease